MASEGRPNTLKFVGFVFLLTVLAIGITWGVVFTFYEKGKPPFMVMVVAGFLSAIEGLIGLGIMNQIARLWYKFRPSTPALIATWAVGGAYAVLGLVALLIYWAVRPEKDPPDKVFFALSAVVTFGFVALAMFIYNFDLFRQGRERPALDKRAEHGRKAHTLAEVISIVRGLDVKDPALLKRLDTLTKTLEGVEVALKHSHGGGVGSYEAKSAAFDEATDKEVGGLVALITAGAERLCGGAEPGPILDEMDGLAAKLRSAMVRLNLA
ncbi:MAG TPA: hypothetical protein P5137_00420 [Candidatus Brocadiia bacterium]|nr:hypothetical protein [Candidatus Brocadiia bacterium]